MSDGDLLIPDSNLLFARFKTEMETWICLPAIIGEIPLQYMTNNAKYRGM
jgi:hypothetical protein